MEQKDIPLVSIITVVYNGEKTIRKTIEAVYNQTYENIQYIVVDGKSTDNTVGVVDSYLSLFNQTEGRSLTLISEKDNGMYDALNKGARLSKGIVVGQTNADDWYEKDAVANMMELYNCTGYDVAWGSANVITSKGNHIKHAKIGKIWSTRGWCHTAMFSKREVLLEYPYVCESMYDDFEYITAVKQAGKKIITTDKIISNFCFGGMSTKKSLKEVRKRVNILYMVYRKYGMSKWYYVDRWIIELTKYFFG